MKVIKKINNNIAFALNKNDEEIIIMGKGVGFSKIPYELNNEGVIESIYVAPKNIKAFDLLNNISEEVNELTEEIINYGEMCINKKLNTSIFLTLLDHISSAIERIEEDMKMNNHLEWQIKHFYPIEYKVGLHAVELMEEKLKVSIPKSEAGFIALHFVNAQIKSGNMTETSKVTAITGEILNIVKYFFKIDLDENSINFSRFVTHLMYFVRRQLNGKNLSDGNKPIFEMMKEKYNNEFKCVEKIEEYIDKKYAIKCSDDEKLYLLMHIQRLIA